MDDGEILAITFVGGIIIFIVFVIHGFFTASRLEKKENNRITEASIEDTDVPKKKIFFTKTYITILCLFLLSWPVNYITTFFSDPITGPSKSLVLVEVLAGISQLFFGIILAFHTLKKIIVSAVGD